jgi:hypothetical protein
VKTYANAFNLELNRKEVIPRPKRKINTEPRASTIFKFVRTVNVMNFKEAFFMEIAFRFLKMEKF